MTFTTSRRVIGDSFKRIDGLTAKAAKHLGPEGKAPLPFLDIVVCNRSRYIDFQLIFHCNCNRNCQGMCIPCMSYMSSISSCLS